VDAPFLAIIAHMNIEIRQNCLYSILKQANCGALLDLFQLARSQRTAAAQVHHQN
jgi:hypothetical protein